MAEAMRTELVGSGIRVVLIAPSNTRTAFFETPPSRALDPTSVAQAFMCALEQPLDVHLSQIVVRPPDEKL
jgi:NADP-dependent 3-hydroxy acid dehydrogenase YdfG